MLRKMYLVSPEYLNTVTSGNTPLPPSPTPNMVGGGKKPSNKPRRRQPVKNAARDERDRWFKKRAKARSDYEKWLKMRDNLHEADVEKKRQMQTVADILKQVLPSSSSPSLPPDSGTQIEPDPPKHIKPETPRVKRRRISYKSAAIPSTSSDVIYETPTPQPSIKRDVDDDDYTSTDDMQVEPRVLDYGAMTGRIGQSVRVAIFV